MRDLSPEQRAYVEETEAIRRRADANQRAAFGSALPSVARSVARFLEPSDVVRAGKAGVNPGLFVSPVRASEVRSKLSARGVVPQWLCILDMADCRATDFDARYVTRLMIAEIGFAAPIVDRNITYLKMQRYDSRPEELNFLERFSGLRELDMVACWRETNALRLPVMRHLQSLTIDLLYPVPVTLSPVRGHWEGLRELALNNCGETVLPCLPGLTGLQFSGESLWAGSVGATDISVSCDRTARLDGGPNAVTAVVAAAESSLDHRDFPNLVTLVIENPTHQIRDLPCLRSLTIRGAYRGVGAGLPNLEHLVFEPNDAFVQLARTHPEDVARVDVALYPDLIRVVAPSLFLKK